MATVVVPFRSGGKSRLPAEIRVEVALAMLGDVLEAAVSHGCVLLVSDAAAAAAIAGELGAEVVADPGGGQGAAVQAALAAVAGACLVVNADLPCVTPAALARLAELGPACVAAPDGTTNALSLPDPSLFTPAYGPGSAARFAAAGLRLVSIPELEHDVDTVADLEALSVPAGSLPAASLPTGPRTTLVLNHHKVVVARSA